MLTDDPETPEKGNFEINIYFDHNFNTTKGTDGFINCGFRYSFNKTFTLLASAGTQIISPASEQKQHFFFLGGLETILKTRKAHS